MPIGMPGWPDLAASTASIASTRMALASSRSGAGETAVAEVISATAGETIGGRKLYSAHERTFPRTALRHPGRLPAPVFLPDAGQRRLVRIPRRPPAGRDVASPPASVRRSPVPLAARLRHATVAITPRLL